MRRSLLWSCLLGALAATLLPAAARATTYTAPQIISSFNVVTSGNLTTQADVEGSAVIGGQLSGGTFFNNDVPQTPVVYTNTQTGNTTLDSGTLYYNSIAGVNLNGGATKVAGGSDTATINAVVSALNAYSAQLGSNATQAGNSYSYSSGKLTFSASAGDSNGDAYITISLATLQSDLTSANSLAFALSGTASTLIINVTGTGTFAPSSGLNFANQNPTQDVLFNFENATTLTLGTWYTSIMAPNAAVSTGNAFDGFIYAASLQAGGELHNFPVTTALPPVKKVPEPATLALLGAGLAALVVRRQRRPAVIRP